MSSKKAKRSTRSTRALECAISHMCTPLERTSELLSRSKNTMFGYIDTRGAARIARTSRGHNKTVGLLSRLATRRIVRQDDCNTAGTYSGFKILHEYSRRKWSDAHECWVTPSFFLSPYKKMLRASKKCDKCGFPYTCSKFVCKRCNESICSSEDALRSDDDTNCLCESCVHVTSTGRCRCGGYVDTPEELVRSVSSVQEEQHNVMCGVCFEILCNHRDECLPPCMHCKKRMCNKHMKIVERDHHPTHPTCVVCERIIQMYTNEYIESAFHQLVTGEINYNQISITHPKLVHCAFTNYSHFIATNQTPFVEFPYSLCGVCDTTVVSTRTPVEVTGVMRVNLCGTLSLCMYCKRAVVVCPGCANVGEDEQDTRVCQFCKSVARWTKTTESERGFDADKTMPLLWGRLMKHISAQIMMYSDISSTYKEAIKEGERWEISHQPSYRNGHGRKNVVYRGWSEFVLTTTLLYYTDYIKTSEFASECLREHVQTLSDTLSVFRGITQFSTEPFVYPTVWSFPVENDRTNKINSGDYTVLTAHSHRPDVSSDTKRHQFTEKAQHAAKLCNLVDLHDQYELVGARLGGSHDKWIDAEFSKDVSQRFAMVIRDHIQRASQDMYASMHSWSQECISGPWSEKATFPVQKQRDSTKQTIITDFPEFLATGD